MVQATHSLVMHGVSELEEWRKEVRVDRKLLRELLRSLGEKVMAEKEVAEVEAGAEKEMEVEVMEVVEEGAEVEKEDGEMVAESRPKKPEGILQASPSTPPST